MDQQHPHPNYQEHHEDHAENALYPLKLALKQNTQMKKIFISYSFEAKTKT